MEEFKGYTFNQVMEILIKLEEKILEAYGEASERSTNLKLKELFASYSRKGIERKETLVTFRRTTVLRMGGLESTLEVALEPITKMDLDAFAGKVDKIIKGEQDYLDKFITIEHHLNELYRLISSDAIRSFPEVSIHLGKLAQENAEREVKLKNLKS